MRRHQRKGFNRDDRMIEEFKGMVTRQEESDDESLKVKCGGEAELEFEEGGNESDYEDQLDSLRQAKRRRREEIAAKENKRIIRSTFLPSTSKKLSACVTCRLVLDKNKWKKNGRCPNCPQSQGLCDTTENFSNLIGSVIPGQSWVASWSGLKDLIPGFYAMSI